MNASKENARVARIQLQLLGSTRTAEKEMIDQFLQAAERRLPSEAAIARDKERKKKYNRKGAKT